MSARGYCVVFKRILSMRTAASGGGPAELRECMITVSASSRAEAVARAHAALPLVEEAPEGLRQEEWGPNRWHLDRVVCDRPVRVRAHRRPFRLGGGIARWHVDRYYLDAVWWRIWVGWGDPRG